MPGHVDGDLRDFRRQMLALDQRRQICETVHFYLTIKRVGTSSDTSVGRRGWQKITGSSLRRQPVLRKTDQGSCPTRKLGSSAAVSPVSMLLEDIDGLLLSKTDALTCRNCPRTGSSWHVWSTHSSISSVHSINVAAYAAPVRMSR